MQRTSSCIFKETFNTVFSAVLFERPLCLFLRDSTAASSESKLFKISFGSCRWYFDFPSLNNTGALSILPFQSPSAAEGSAECRPRPPCSEKDYFQLHTACGQDGKVRGADPWVETALQSRSHAAALSALRFRRRSRTSGSNRRSAWRECRGPSRCPLVASGSPALPATPASTTTTRPPARRAHLGPTLTAWNVLKN